MFATTLPFTLRVRKSVFSSRASDLFQVYFVYFTGLTELWLDTCFDAIKDISLLAER
jgi:hypothetical protein